RVRRWRSGSPPCSTVSRTCGSIPTRSRRDTSACTSAAPPRSPWCSANPLRRQGRIDVNEPGYTAPDISLLGEEHIRRYRETDGEVGYLWNGAPTLLLTTTGRRTGEPRTSALIFGRDGDDYLVVASLGGAPQHPSWYLNLNANPVAEIQV